MLISWNLHMKRSEVSIKTRSTPASLSFKGQGTKHTTVKWCIFVSLSHQRSTTVYLETRKPLTVEVSLLISHSDISPKFGIVNRVDK